MKMFDPFKFNKSEVMDWREAIDHRYIPKEIDGWLWIGNSDATTAEDAEAEYRPDNPGTILQVLAFSPDTGSDYDYLDPIRWAVYRKV